MKKTDPSSTKTATTAQFDEAIQQQMEAFRDREFPEELTSLAEKLSHRLSEAARRG
ncbi:hypothetical protein GI582_20030 [Sulfitobacter sp. BDSS02]|nr:hypothetical protein [Sulfitobacter sp. BDSS02]MBR9850930.1 hypothetical protein [Paracoccaceae bacterium]